MPIPLAEVAKHLSRHTSPLELVLRSHLWVEAGLEGVIASRLKRPSSVKLDRMNFAGKVDLAHALGAIDSDDVGWFRTLNKMRNRLAHDLTGTPTQDELERLADAVAGFPREILDGTLELAGQMETVGAARLPSAFIVRLILLEYSRMHETWRRTNREALLNYRIQRALMRITQEEITPEIDDALRTRCGVPNEPRPLDAVEFPEAVNGKRSGSTR